MKNTNDISNYIATINLKGNNPLKFLIEDGITISPYQRYAVRKIISQLEVREHINLLGPVIKAYNPEEILRTNSA